MVKSLNHVTDDLNHVNQILRPFSEDIKRYSFLNFNGLIFHFQTWILFAFLLDIKFPFDLYKNMTIDNK